jgi:hypothetical protein
MKNSRHIILAISIILALSACKKSEIVIPKTANINVTNVVAAGKSISLNIDAQPISNNSYANYVLFAGQSQVNLYTLAVAATPIAAAIPPITYYNQTVPTSVDGLYSLFLSGASPSNIDATWVTENHPYAYPDSVVGVRFINLSANSNPIAVNIKGNASGSEAASLAYKAYSSFILYAAKKVNPSYIFEFRDAGTGNLIISYTLATPTPLFHNVTIVLRGLIGGIPAPGITLDNDY